MTRTHAALHLIAVATVVACSGPGTSGFHNNGGASGSSGSSGSGSGGSSGGGGSGGVPPLGGPDGGDAGKGCGYADSTDHDGDGWSFAQGDCDDCDPTINPGAYDIPKDGIDEDCSGTADDEPTACDTGLALASIDPMEGAKAMDLCRQTTETATGKARTWGVIAAQYVLPDGTTTPNANFNLGFGILPAFGVNTTQQGVSMLGLSSGSARQPGDPGYLSVSGFDKGYTSNAPPPYPKPVPACGPTKFGRPHDGVALQLTIRVPTNAKTLSYDQNFFSYEFPVYICSSFNDTFITMMSPRTTPSLPDDNIAFDSMGNPISVNNALLQVCSPQVAGGKTFTCPLGTAGLSGTGFEGHAATGWLTTTAPVDSIKGTDVTLLFAIWDSSDGILDSSVLLDNFTWGFTAPTGGPTTTPTPPK